MSMNTQELCKKFIEILRQQRETLWNIGYSLPYLSQYFDKIVDFKEMFHQVEKLEEPISEEEKEIFQLEYEMTVLLLKLRLSECFQNRNMYSNETDFSFLSEMYAKCNIVKFQDPELVELQLKKEDPLLKELAEQLNINTDEFYHRQQISSSSLICNLKNHPEMPNPKL